MSDDSSDFELNIPQNNYSGSRSPNKKSKEDDDDSSASFPVNLNETDESNSEEDSDFSENEEFIKPKRGRKAKASVTQSNNIAQKKTVTKKTTNTKKANSASSANKVKIQHCATINKTSLKSVGKMQSNNVKMSTTITTNSSDCPTSVHKPLHETLKLYSPKVGLSRRISSDNESGIPTLGGRLRQGLSKLSKPREPLHKTT